MKSRSPGWEFGGRGTLATRRGRTPAPVSPFQLSDRGVGVCSAAPVQSPPPSDDFGFPFLGGPDPPLLIDA